MQISHQTFLIILLLALILYYHHESRNFRQYLTSSITYETLMGNVKRLALEQIFNEYKYLKELKPNTNEIEQLQTLLAL